MPSSRTRKRRTDEEQPSSRGLFAPFQARRPGALPAEFTRTCRRFRFSGCKSGGGALPWVRAWRTRRVEGGGTHIPAAGVLAGVRLSESGLAFSSQALLQLFENIPVAICITAGTDHRFVYANSHYRRALVPDSGDPAGRRLVDLFGAALRPETYAIRDQVLAQSRVVSVSESPVRDGRSGSAMYWDITYFPVADGIAAKRGILTFAIDVTERVAARREAEERAAAERARAEEATYDRQRLALAVEATGLGIWEWNVETGETHWSDRQKEIWGLSPEDDATYDHWRASIHPEDRDG